MTDKKGLLPIVTQETKLAVLFGEIKKGSGGKYIAETLKRIEEDNPVVANLIGEFSKHSKEPIKIACAAAAIYRILEGQAEADKMNREFSFKDYRGESK